MALRNGLLVHGPTYSAAPCARTGARCSSPRGASRGCASADPRFPVCAASLGWRRRSRSSPWSSAGSPRRGSPSRTRRCSRSRPARRRAACSFGGACAGRPARWPPRPSPSCRPCSRCAAVSSPQYHGVEHKAIGAYEAGTDDAADATKEHERCGSHLVAPMLASNLAGTLLLRRAVEKPGPLAGGAVALASTAVAVESSGGAAARRHAHGAGAQAPRLRAPATGRHARARRAPARGRPRCAGGDPAGRGQPDR